MTQSQQQPARTATASPSEVRPWFALSALCVGFFMILVDTTIVSVATPAIIEDLDADVNSVVWVTSAYLLAYAVPVLITGRLGDRYGPKRLYLAGLAAFTAASLWCGLTGTVEMLIVARVVQGLGAGLMTPQTMAVITRVFPAERRGQAMSLWGATAGVATLVGPVLGGVLVDGLGWEWIFFVNVPVGLVALALAARWVPRLETHPHRFDLLGVLLSGLAMFLLVFGLQEAHQYDWATISGPFTVWRLIIAGLVVLALFVWWQARNPHEPLVPLALFGDRNFSLASIGIATVGFGFTAMGFPVMLYAQLVRGYSPTEAGLMLVPLAVASLVLARPVGRLTDQVHPRLLAGFGFATMIVAMLLLSWTMTPDVALWRLLGAIALIGVGSSFLWAPLSATANRNLPMRQAGAGAGVFNAARLIGAVLGSAAIAVLIDARLSANGLGGGGGAGSAGVLPDAVRAGFSEAMAQALYVVPGVMLIGLVAVLFFALPRHLAPGAQPKRPEM